MNKLNIKNMAAAMQQVKEGTATQRALASIKAQPKDKVSVAPAPWDKKKEDPKKEGMSSKEKMAKGLYASKEEAVDLDKANADKAVQHDCATHVEHADWGKGQPISEQHTIVETAPGVGYVTHYDVMFEHGIEKNVAVEDLDILSEMSHGHSKKKNEAIKLRGFGPDHKKASGSSLKKIAGKNEAVDPVDKKELKGKLKDREDADIDNDGDVDSSDKYLHKRRKAISKNTKENGVEMNPSKKTNKAAQDNVGAMESVLPPVYARIMEARKHDDKANPSSPAGEGLSPKAKEMKTKMDSGNTADKISNYDELGHSDAAKAGRVGPKAKARSGDNMKGDKSIVKPLKAGKGY